jgi:RNA polymerase sigma factor (TIGR02999 family)
MPDTPSDSQPQEEPQAPTQSGASPQDAWYWEHTLYNQLRKLAAQKMAQEAPGQTLQATALVHEAYLRLVDVQKAQNWDSRGHFFSAAAEAMRRILVERARRKRSLRKGGGLRQRGMNIDQLEQSGAIEDVLAIDEALEKLACENRSVAKLVELRYFAGLTLEEAASSLKVSVRTAYRYWAYARAWLHHEISAEPEDRPPDPSG